MKQRILLLCDLEGVNHVVGEPYHGLGRGSEEWEIARREAARELNAAAGALLEAGVSRISLWDNHGSGKNIEKSDLDPRIEVIEPEGPRMSFARDRFDAACFFGYHAMEGTLGGVLAHTFSSVSIQYYKLNGRYVGEVDMDAAIAGSYGIPCVFYAAGDIACLQARRAVPGIVTVATKTELSRNRAIFRDDRELMDEIREKTVEALGDPPAPQKLSFPAVLEKSFKRVEDAALYLEKLLSAGMNAEYPADELLGHDAHAVRAVIRSMEEFVFAL